MERRDPLFETPRPAYLWSEEVADAPAETKYAEPPEFETSAGHLLPLDFGVVPLAVKDALDQKNLAKRRALLDTFGRRVQANINPLLLVTAMSLLAASNLFFAQIPGSVGLLWIVTVVFFLMILYRLVADAEDEAGVKYKQLIGNYPFRINS